MKRQTEFTMTLNMTARESEALTRLARSKDLTKAQVMRQALRLYELISERNVLLVDRDAPEKRATELLIL